MIQLKQIGLAFASFSLSRVSYAESNITSDTHFYGQSEPVYPSRGLPLIPSLSRILISPANGTGAGDWAHSYTKAAALVSQMTLEEKVSQSTTSLVALGTPLTYFNRTI